MLKKTLIATATAGMIAACALAGTATAASASSASGSLQFGGPNWNVQIGNFGHGKHRQQCRPIVKTVKYWKWGRPHWQQVVVGYDCHRRGPRHGGPPFPGPWFPGWGW